MRQDSKKWVDNHLPRVQHLEKEPRAVSDLSRLRKPSICSVPQLPHVQCNPSRAEYLWLLLRAAGVTTQ